jgi:hypothetical protein
VPTDLRFVGPYSTPAHDAVNLRFGDDGDVPPVLLYADAPIRVSVDALLNQPGDPVNLVADPAILLTVSATLAATVQATISAPILVGVTAEMFHRSLGFDPQARRHTGFVAPWGASARLQPERRYPWGAAVRQQRDVRAPWAPAVRLQSERRYPWGQALRRERDLYAPWAGRMTVVQPERRYPWGPVVWIANDLHAPWAGRMAVVQLERRYPWGAVARTDLDRIIRWAGAMAVVQPERRIPWGQSQRVQWEQHIPWTRFSRTLNPGWGIVTPNNPGQVPGETITIPTQRVYLMENEILMTRADTLEIIPAQSASLNIDVNSWTWGFNATVPAAALDDLQPNLAGDPVVLILTVNGVVFRVIVERISRDREFGKASLRISGRGHPAVLDKPYSAIGTWTNDQARTAQQLVGDVLTVNTVPLGWTIDWRITDWLVPTGAFNVRGSYIDAVNSIARAAGAFVQPDPSEMTLRIRALYPVAPWDWATVTPDYVLPASAVNRESIEWVEKPAYNGVYVAGEGQGILAHVRRTGTAGDLLAEMVVDRLITETDAARQRGLSILADTGKQATVGLRTPVFEASGVIEPGSFIQFNDGATVRRGYVRSTRVDLGRPSVWQYLEVETHV